LNFSAQIYAYSLQNFFIVMIAPIFISLSPVEGLPHLDVPQLCFHPIGDISVILKLLVSRLKTLIALHGIRNTGTKSG
jgi:hypothetical protein